MRLAFAMVNSEPVQSKLVLERIGEVEGVKEVYRTFGIYDIVAVIKFETTEELKGIILKIRTVKHVVATLTLMVVE
jgi:DNA-binding Lrp family transcriptional regulator